MTGRGPDRAATNTHRIVSERLILEVPVEADAPALYALVGGEDRSEITAGLRWDGPDEISETLAFIEQARSGAYGDHGFNWVIRDREGRLSPAAETPLGMIGTRPSREPGRGDIGYWLGKPYWGQGIMREAVSHVLDLCFHGLDLVKVEAEVFVDNTRSMRVVESVGMTREGTIRRAVFKRGLWVDAHLYGLVREEWNP